MAMNSVTKMAIVTDLVIHLFRAVEDVDHDTERSTQILGRLGFTRTSRSGRSTAHNQMERLRQCDVTPEKRRNSITSSQ